MTTNLLEQDIPDTINIINIAETHDIKLTSLRKKALSIREAIIAARKLAVEKAEEGARIASLKAIAEKDRAQKAYYELLCAKTDAQFVKNNMPLVGATEFAKSATHTAYIQTLAFFQALEKYWSKEALDESVARTKTYVSIAENSAKEAKTVAQNTQERYQNILQKNKNLALQDTIFNTQSLAHKASIDTETALMAVHEIQIKNMLILRLYEQDIRSIYTISQVIEKSVHTLNLAYNSVQKDNTVIVAKTNLDKISASFEANIQSACDGLLQIAKIKL